MNKKSQQNTFLQNLLNWVKEDPLLKLGGLFILLSIGWFLQKTFANGVIGPNGQLTLGLLTGAILLIFGNKWAKSKTNIATTFTILGGLTIIGTGFAGRNIHDLLTPNLTFGIMLLTVIYMSIQAIKHNKLSIATISLIGGALTPAFINSPEPNYLFFFSYLALLNIGTAIVSSKKDWRSLSFLAFLFTAFFSLELGSLSSNTAIWIFMAIFYLQFLYNNVNNILRSKKFQIADALLGLGNGLLITMWILEYTPGHLHTLLFCLLGLAGVFVCQLLKKQAQFKNLFFIYLTLSLVYLATATSMAFDGPALVIAFAFEALALTFLSSERAKNYGLCQLSSLTYAAPLLLSLDYFYNDYPYQLSLFNESFFVLLTIAISTYCASQIIPKLKPKKAPYPISSIALFAIAAIYAYRFIWLLNESLFSAYSMAKAASLTLYTLIGLGSIYYGTKHNSCKHKYLGKITIGLVTLRLIFTEAWQMTDTYRMLTFLIIGVLFVATAFFNRKK